MPPEALAQSARSAASQREAASGGLGAGPNVLAHPNQVAHRILKRSFDLIFSALALALFSWLFALIALAIKLDDPAGTVFFSQTRIGEGGRPFRMYKFRSMSVDAESQLEKLRGANERRGPSFKMSNDPRMTRVGRAIRRISLDELPQFVNVLKGDLSVVGPRPALPSEVAEYTPRQLQRLCVPQGLTCIWQATPQRDKLSFDEQVELDLEYIRNQSLRLDFSIIARTVVSMLTLQGR